MDKDKHHRKAHLLRPMLEDEGKVINLEENNYHWDKQKVISCLFNFDIVDFLVLDDYIESSRII